jgi:hypothetical protein
MLAPRSDFGAVVANGTLYAIGGVNNYVLPPGCAGTVGIYDTVLASVEAYSFVSRSWRYVASLPMPAAIDGAVVGADGRIYVLAFPNADGPYGGAVVYAYNPASNTWTTAISNIPPIPSPKGPHQNPGIGPMTVVGPNRELLLLENDNGDGDFPAAAFTHPT